MTTVFVTAGVACIIAAIVGGGLKAFGMEIPALKSRARRIALASFGTVLTFAGIMLDRHPFIREPSASFTDPGQKLARATTCLEEYFRSMPKDRISNVEAGARDHQLIGPHQPKDQPIGIIFRENRQPIGAMKFEFFSGSNSFKINSAVDASCQPVEDYRNATRSGNKRVLQNWDDLQIRFGNAEYGASLEYGQGAIDTDFIRIAPTR